MRSNIVMCGFMGAGKSRLGAGLAGKLQIDFIDLDSKITECYGKPISEMFRKEGEAFFRKTEQDMLAKYLDSQNRILSLGGGAISSIDQASEIKEKNLLIFINPPFHIIIKRVVGDPRRPLANESGGYPLEPATAIRKLHELYEQRLPVYRQAHFTFVPKDTWPVNASVANLYKKVLMYDERNKA